jgi:ATP-dependent DNA helicase RecQ
VDTTLLGRLKDLRQKIAAQQRVPAYVIFPDSALTDMCLKRPGSRGELLLVSGVGQVKADRYGQAFLAAIAEFAAEPPSPEGGEPPGASAAPGAPAAAVEISQEPVTVTVIADRLNCLLLQQGAKKITGAKINTWLLQEGYLAQQTVAGRPAKVPTPQGAALGIASVEREIRGAPCLVNFYSPEAQRFIAENLERFPSPPA